MHRREDPLSRRTATRRFDEAGAGSGVQAIVNALSTFGIWYYDARYTAPGTTPPDISLMYNLLSPGLYDVPQFTAANQPTKVSQSGIVTADYVRVSADYMRLQLGAGSMGTVGDYLTLWVVFELKSSPPANVGIVEQSNAGVANRGISLFTQSTTTLSGRLLCSAGSLTASLAGVVDTNKHLARVTGTPSQLELYLDEGTPAVAAGNCALAGFAQNDLAFGNIVTLTATWFLNGYVGAAALSRNGSAAQIAAVTKLFQQEYF